MADSGESQFRLFTGSTGDPLNTFIVPAHLSKPRSASELKAPLANVRLRLLTPNEFQTIPSISKAQRGKCRDYMSQVLPCV